MNGLQDTTWSASTHSPSLFLSASAILAFLLILDITPGPLHLLSPPLNVHMASSLTSFKSRFKYHLLNKVFLEDPPLSLSTPVLFSLHCSYCLWYMPSPFRMKLHFVSVHYYIPSAKKGQCWALDKCLTNEWMWSLPKWLKQKGRCQEPDHMESCVLR